MNVAFTDSALDDLGYWVRNNARMAKKILELIELARRTPYSGLGKPEPLKHRLSGRWSRRIDDEHRLIYRIVQQNGESVLEISSCRFNYAER